MWGLGALAAVLLLWCFGWGFGGCGALAGGFGGCDVRGLLFLGLLFLRLRRLVTVGWWLIAEGWGWGTDLRIYCSRAYNL